MGLDLPPPTLRFSPPPGQPFFQTAQMVEAHPAPVRPRPDADHQMKQDALHELRPESLPPYQSAALVKSLLDQSVGEVKDVLDRETLRTAFTDADGKRKIGHRAAHGLESARESAEKSLRALDAFTGKELAHAIGDRHAGSDADKAVRRAIQDQFTLAARLRAAAEKSGGDAELLALAHQADMRGCEIGRLASQLHALAVKEDRDAESLKAAEVERLSRKGVAGIGAAQAKNSPMAAAAFAQLQKDVQPLIDRFLQNVNQDAITPEQVFASHLYVNAIRNIVADARANGVDVGGQGVRVRMDAQVLAPLEAKLAEWSQRVADAGTTVAKAVAKQFVDDFICPRGDAVAWPADDTSLKAALSLIDESRQLLRDFVDGKTSREVVERDMVKPEQFRGLGEYVQKLAKRKDDPAMRDFAERLLPQSLVADDGSTGLAHLLDHVEQILRRGKDVDLTQADVDLVFHGHDFSKVTEIRMNGYEAEDLEPAGVVADHVEAAGTDKGGVNSVTRLVYRDANQNVIAQRIFKPEMPGRVGLVGIDAVGKFLSRVAPETQVLDFNMASHEVADLLGCGHVVVQTHAEVYKGVFGMSMEQARGNTVQHVIGGTTGDVDCATPLDIARFDPDRRQAVKGEIVAQLNQLQWMDLITGQLDRHDGNYFVFVSPLGDAVEVKGIDNDASFPDRVVGIGRYLLDEKKVDAFCGACCNLFAQSTDPEEQAKLAAAKAKLIAEGGLQALPDGGYVLDTTKLDDYERAVAAFDVTAMNVTRSIPDCMDYRVYRGIVSYTEGDPGFKEFRALLAKRHLSPSQIEAAVGRLKDARAYADALRETGRIFGAEEWSRPELLDELGKRTQSLDMMAAYAKTLPRDASRDSDRERERMGRIRAAGETYVSRRGGTGVQSLFREIDRLVVEQAEDDALVAAMEKQVAEMGDDV